MLAANKIVCLSVPKKKILSIHYRVCTIRTYVKVLDLILGVKPEPNLMVVLLQLGSVSLVGMGHRDTNRTLGRTRAI